MQDLEIVCPDCGTTYAVRPEQAGKLLHCKCGRYLVASAGDSERAQEPAHVPVEPPQPDYAKTQRIDIAALQQASEPSKPANPPDYAPTQRLNVADLQRAQSELKVKPPAPKPADQPHAPEPKPAASAPSLGNKKTLAISGGIIAVIAIVGVLLMRPSAKPAQHSAPVHAAQLPAPAAAPNTSAAACGANAVRLDNGATVERSLLGSGMGKLTIENQTPSDASVRLINDGDLTVAWVYVQQGKSVTLSTMPLGSHRLFYSTGSDWDKANESFRCNDTYVQFQRPVDFTEVSDGQQTSYSTRKITLGKTPTTPISKDIFFRGHISRPM